jgi:fatty acid desaturase
LPAARAAREALAKSPASRENAPRRKGGTMRLVLVILGVILVVAAIAGGIAVSKLLWLLLILALVVFAIGALTGRITE